VPPVIRRALRAAAVVAALLGGLAVLWLATRQQALHACEACVALGDRELCRRVEAATRAEAERGAIANACSIVAEGVTDTLACERSAVRTLRCEAP